MFVRDQPGQRNRPTVLLLHGLTSTADLCWFATFPRLEGRYRVVAPDLRGHGDGPHAGRFSLEDVADDVAALIDRLGLGKVVVGGYSMGGVVAQLLWRRHRDAVAGLVLCATAADFRPVSARGRASVAARRALLVGARVVPPSALRRLELHIGRAGLRRTTIRQSTEPLREWAAAQIRRNPPLGLVAATVALRSSSTEAWIGGIDVPTACVIPIFDTVVPVAQQQALARSIHGAIVVELRADHGGFVQRPDDFADAVVSAVTAVADRVT